MVSICSGVNVRVFTTRVKAGNNGDVAMLLMTNTNELFTNEIARQKLHEFWDENNVYNYNIEFLLPIMTEQLENDIISVNGVKTTGKLG